MFTPTHEDSDYGDLLANAYDEGEGAKATGDKHNPYRRGSAEWQEWWLGWHAKEDNRD